MILGGSYTREGCNEGWVFYNQLCYLYNPHPVDAITAKDICSTYKDATLTSIWDIQESQFILDLLLTVSGVHGLALVIFSMWRPQDIFQQTSQTLIAAKMFYITESLCFGQKGFTSAL